MNFEFYYQVYNELINSLNKYHIDKKDKIDELSKVYYLINKI